MSYKDLFFEGDILLMNQLVVSVSHCERGVEKFNTNAIAFYKACGIDQESLLLGREFYERRPGQKITISRPSGELHIIAARTAPAALRQ
jgi:hypothetical protein